jgi:diacylglycerol kinase (ATP)
MGALGSICCHVSEPIRISRKAPAIVFVNPHAGGGQRQSRLAETKALLAARSFPIEYVFTESVEDMESRVRVAISKECHVLVAMGGDGTLHALVNAAYGSEVVLGVLPAGGGNDFAAHVGVPKNLMEAAIALPSFQVRCMDVLRARTADGRERLYLGGGGLGLDADAARYAACVYARLPGRLRYIAAALRALREFKPLHVRAEFPGSNLPAMDAQVLLAGALNTRSYGAGLRLAPDARIDDGLLTAVFVKNLGGLEVLAALPRLLIRGDLPDSYVNRVSASCMRLTADRECLFHGDGEILGPAPVDIEVLPRAARVLAP